MFQVYLKEKKLTEPEEKTLFAWGLNTFWGTGLCHSLLNLYLCAYYIRDGPLEIPGGGGGGQKISSARICFSVQVVCRIFFFLILSVFFWMVDCLQDFYFFKFSFAGIFFRELSPPLPWFLMVSPLFMSICNVSHLVSGIVLALKTHSFVQSSVAM